MIIFIYTQLFEYYTEKLLKQKFIFPQMLLKCRILFDK